jgi:hypothetical protein
MPGSKIIPLKPEFGKGRGEILLENDETREAGLLNRKLTVKTDRT